MSADSQRQRKRRSAKRSQSTDASIEFYDFVVIGGGIAGVTCIEELLKIINQPSNNAEFRDRSINASQIKLAIVSCDSQLKGVSKLSQVSSKLMEVEVAEYSSNEFITKQSKFNYKHIPLTVFQGFVQSVNPRSRGDDTSNDDKKSININGITFYDIPNNQNKKIAFGKCLIAAGGSPRRFYVSKREKIKDKKKSFNSSNDSDLNKNSNMNDKHSSNKENDTAFSQFNRKHPLIQVLRDNETVSEFMRKISDPNCKTVVIVGNGGISLEIVYAMYQNIPNTEENIKKIIWVIRHNNIGNTFLDGASAAFLIPQLFPQKDPNCGQGRKQGFKEYNGIYSDTPEVIIDVGNKDSKKDSKSNLNSNANATEEKKNNDEIKTKHKIFDFNNNQRQYGGAVGPRWVGQLAHVKQEPLWMDKIEHYGQKDKQSQGQQKHNENSNQNDSDINMDNPNDNNNNNNNNDSDDKDKTLRNEIILQTNCEVSDIIEIKNEEKTDNVEKSENKNKNKNKSKSQLQVTLSNGSIINADLLLCAMGVVPNTSFCDSKVFDKYSKDGFGSALIVNEFLQTNVDDVYAAGDCCHIVLDEWKDNMDEAKGDTSNNIDASESKEALFHAWFQMRLWSQSQLQGFIAAHSMTTNDYENDISLLFNFEMFGHITKFFDKKCVFLGRYNLLHDDDKNGIKILMRIKPEKELIKLILKNGRCIGAVLIGQTDLEETCENLILNKHDVSMFGEAFLHSGVDLEDMFD